MKSLLVGLSLMVCGCLSGLALTARNEPPCDTARHCGSPGAPLPSSTPACAAAGQAQLADEWDLWRGGTCLRGANLWARRFRADTAVESDSVWPRFSQEDFATLHAWGANLAVLSFPGPYTEINRLTGYGPDRPVWTALERSVDDAASAGLYVVVAFRTGPGRNEAAIVPGSGTALQLVWDSAAGSDARAAWVRMWVDAARWLKHKPNVVGYELMVEPERPDHLLWGELAQAIAVAVRVEDPQTPIIVGGADWGTPCSLPHLVRPNVRRLVLSVHTYMPEAYVRNCRNNAGWSAADLETLYSRAREVAGTTPLTVTEYGVFNRARGAAEFLEVQSSIIERASANHALWDWQPAYVIVDGRMDIRRSSTTERAAIRRIWSRNLGVPEPPH